MVNPMRSYGGFEEDEISRYEGKRTNSGYILEVEP